jgi:hypothetical protein
MPFFSLALVTTNPLATRRTHLIRNIVHVLFVEHMAATGIGANHWTARPKLMVDGIWSRSAASLLAVAKID